MLKIKKSVTSIILFLITIFLSLTIGQASTFAFDRLKTEKPLIRYNQTSNENITASVWVSPSSRNNKSSKVAKPQSNSTNKIMVKAGAAIPIKFRLFDAGNEITSANELTITQTAGSSCSFNVKAKVNSGKASNLRYTENGFEAVFKTDKTSSGCFKFVIKRGTSELLNSPEFAFNK